ncbi:hypothetical protein ACLKA6_017777 [Drosophila palustris]
MFADDVAVLETYGPEIDLDSSCFKDDDYTKLKEKIESNKESYPDIKIVDEYVYMRTLHYDGSEEGQQQCWKLASIVCSLTESASPYSLAKPSGLDTP